MVQDGLTWLSIIPATKDLKLCHAGPGYPLAGRGIQSSQWIPARVPLLGYSPEGLKFSSFVAGVIESNPTPSNEDIYDSGTPFPKRVIDNKIENVYFLTSS
jgi:hypothetical protein